MTSYSYSQNYLVTFPKEQECGVFKNDWTNTLIKTSNNKYLVKMDGPTLKDWSLEYDILIDNEWTLVLYYYSSGSNILIYILKKDDKTAMSEFLTFTEPIAGACDSPSRGTFTLIE